MAKLILQHPLKSLSGQLSREFVIKHFRETGETHMVARRGPDRVRRQRPREAACQQAFKMAMKAVRKLLKDEALRSSYQAKVERLRRQGRSVNVWNLALSDYIKTHPGGT